MPLGGIRTRNLGRGEQPLGPALYFNIAYVEDTSFPHSYCLEPIQTTNIFWLVSRLDRLSTVN
jgi:hypothetical protein